MSMNKSGRTPKKKKKKRQWMHVHEQKWTDTKKTKKREEGCMSMNKSGRTPKKKEKKK